MRAPRDFRGLLKIADLQFQTVGDFMHSWNADINADQDVRRSAFDRINGSGTDVKSPASRIPWILGGGIAGRQAAKYLGANPFWRNVATVGGALIGNGMYNDRHPDFRNQKIAPGMINRGW